MLKDLLNKYLESEEDATKKFDAWERDPESEELELSFDAAYKKEWACFTDLAWGLVEFCCFNLTYKEACKLLRSKRNELIKLINSL